MNFEEALLEMITKGKRISIAENKPEMVIAYDPDIKKICFWHEEVDKKGSHYGCEVAFTDEARTSNQWCVISDLPKNMVNCCTPAESLCTTCRNTFVCPMQSTAIVKSCEMYQKLPNPLEEIINGFTTRSLNPIKEEKPMESAERIEITFKSGETISYGKGEWDDYAYDGKAVIVKKNGAWIGIYNFNDVFCVELKEK